MSGDSIKHGTKFGAYEARFQQMESGSVGGQPVNSETGESAVGTHALWYGLVFKLEDIHLVIPCTGEPATGEPATGEPATGEPATGDLGIASCGEISPLPLVKSWIVGMTHIRGEIYTVMDFSDFLGKKKISVVAGCNLILLPDLRLKSALLLAGRVRLQSFDVNLPVTGVKLDCALTPYLSRVLIDNGQNWGVIDIDALSNSAQFLRIGRASQ